MQKVFAVAPGAVWCAIILGLSLGATWLADYMGAAVPAWLPPLILTVIVPVLKVLADTQAPPTLRAEQPEPVRSKFNRWLW